MKQWRFMLFSSTSVADTPEQPDLAEDVPAHCREAGLDDL